MRKNELHTPGQGKLLGKVVKVFVKSLGNVLVRIIIDETEIAGQHRRLAELALDEGIGISSICRLGLPLRSAARTCDECPFVIEERS